MEFKLQWKEMNNMKTKEYFQDKLELLEELWTEAVQDILKYSNDDSQEGQWRKSTAQSTMVYIELKIKSLGGRQNG